MRIRLHGLPADVDVAVTLLETVFAVVAVSSPAPDRRGGTEVRVYVDVRLPTAAGRRRG